MARFTLFPPGSHSNSQHAFRDRGARPRARIRCPICAQPVDDSFVVRGYRMYDCRRCDFAFIDPATAAAYRSSTMFDDAYFTSGGAGYTNYCAEGHLLRGHGRRYGHLLRGIGARTVLDVGTAAGYVLAGLEDAGCRGTGIEPNDSMAAFARQTLELDVMTSTLESFESDERFDAVALLQVIDHLEDVHRALVRLQALVRPSGWCIVEFGDRASLTARVLGTAWHEYAPPSVQRVFSGRALTALFAEYGFSHAASGRPRKYLHAEHALSLLEYALPHAVSRAAIAPLIRILPPELPLRYPGDDVRWMLFQRTARHQGA